MHRTTLTLTDELVNALKREARRRDVSVSVVVRDALSKHFDLDNQGPRELPFGPPGHSGYHDTSERIDEILQAEWDDAGNR